MIDNILLLIFAHFISDIVFQHERYAFKKGVVLRYMLTHCFLYAGGMSMALYWLGHYALWKAVVLFLSHYIIDSTLYIKSDPFKTGITGWIDQIGHILILGGVYLL